MKQTIFTGMATAMVTPMTPEGVDYENADEWAEEVANRGDRLFDAESSVGVSDYGDMDYEREITSEEVE